MGKWWKEKNSEEDLEEVLKEMNLETVSLRTQFYWKLENFIEKQLYKNSYRIL